MNKRSLISKKNMLILVSLSLLVLSIFIIAFFTGKTADESDSLSKGFAKTIEKVVGRNFQINPSNIFWTETLNRIIRKLGHVAEFALLGLTACIFFVLVVPRKWVSVLVSVALCSLIAITDEFRQTFFEGRGPSWFDVRLDILGSLFGIAVAFIAYLVYKKIERSQRRINKVEISRKVG